MRLVVTDQSVEILLSRWEKVLGLMRDIRVSRADISDVRVVEAPMHEVMLIRFKVGLRLPWLYYVARSIRLDQAFFVRRGSQAISFSVANQYPLTRVLLSTPDAQTLAQELRAEKGRPSPGPERALESGA